MFSPEIYRNKERNNYMHHFFFQKQNKKFFTPELMADHVGNLAKKKRKEFKRNKTTLQIISIKYL